MDKYLLKNVDKYEKIKLNSGVNLNKLSYTKREQYVGEIGLSTKTYGGLWFNMQNGKKAIFKTFENDVYKGIRKQRIVNELICMCLAEQIGLECAKYEPAHKGFKIGLVSYNFLSDNEDTITLENILKIENDSSNNLKDAIHCLEKYCKLKRYTYNKRDAIVHLYKTIILDTLTLQSDRHQQNINFIINKDNNEIKSAPYYDNEFAFIINDLDDIIRKKE